MKDDATAKHYLYKYDVNSMMWNMIETPVQVKKVKFGEDALLYYLTPNNCVLDPNFKLIICGIIEFVILKGKKIIGIHDGVSDIP